MSECPCRKPIGIHLGIPGIVQIIQGYVHHLTDKATFRLCESTDLHVACVRKERKQKRGRSRKPGPKYSIHVGSDAEAFDSQLCLKKGIKCASIRIWRVGVFACLGIQYHDKCTYVRYSYIDTTLSTYEEEFCHRYMFRQILPENRLESVSGLHTPDLDGPFPRTPALDGVPKEFNLACEWMQNAIFRARIDAGLWNAMHGCNV